MDGAPTTDPPIELFVFVFGLTIALLIAMWVLAPTSPPSWQQGIDGVPWWGPEFASVPVVEGTLYWDWSDDRVEGTEITLSLLKLLVTRCKESAPMWYHNVTIPPAVRMAALIWRIPGNDIPPWRCIDAAEVVFHNQELLDNTDRVDAYHKELATAHPALFDKVFEEEADAELKSCYERWHRAM